MLKPLISAVVIFSAALSSVTGHPAGRNSFRPPDCGLAAGDETLKAEHTPKKRNAVSSVYNGFQGGAYFLIRFFQVAVSPQDGPNCRHRPTCSAYGRQAVVKHGAFWGAVMAGERLLRCNPYYPPGNDPVPDKRPFSK
jgi:hypothetical protein